MPFSVAAQIVLAVLGLYGTIIGAAVLRSKVKAANAPKVAPVFPDFHTGTCDSQLQLAPLQLFSRGDGGMLCRVTRMRCRLCVDPPLSMALLVVFSRAQGHRTHRGGRVLQRVHQRER